MVATSSSSDSWGSWWVGYVSDLRYKNDSGPCTPRLGKPEASGMALQSLASKMIPVPQFANRFGVWVSGVSGDVTGYAALVLLGHRCRGHVSLQLF